MPANHCAESRKCGKNGRLIRKSSARDRCRCEGPPRSGVAAPQQQTTHKPDRRHSYRNSLPVPVAGLPIHAMLLRLHLTTMKIIFLPESDMSPPGWAGHDPARPVDRVAGPAYVIHVDVAPVTMSDELTQSEWSAFTALS